MNSARIAVARHLSATFRWPVLLFWCFIGTGTIVVGYLARRGVIPAEAETLRNWTATSPVKYFLLVIAIVAGSMLLRLYVAYGITRRDATAGVGTFFVVAGTAFVPVAVVFTLIGAAVSGSGAFGQQFTNLTSGLGAAGLAWIGFLAWSCAGWLIAVGYVRFGALRGTLFIPIAVLPMVAMEVPSGLGVSGLVTAVSAVTGLVLGGWLAFGLARGVEIRKVLGGPV